jgi:hypothetical protein
MLNYSVSLKIEQKTNIELHTDLTASTKYLGLDPRAKVNTLLYIGKHLHMNLADFSPSILPGRGF